ncbi:calcium-binding protein [uncultured Sulfitobacter sp.]|uniref:calcium-binding protein n=1 Tax=uncultured Sulfitobacter sp. TaxID=191468 RepID=UPI0026210EDE|nr:calcium-binding protein [uncultured Sulfitobacter sp.]
MTDRPNLIIHSASSSSNVWTLKNNLDFARTVEMDGMVMNGASSWNLMKPGVAISLEDTRNQMNGFEDFNAEYHNYFLTQTDDPGDVFNDAAWAQVVDNFRTVALAAREAGYQGLIFDNEEYNGKWQNYPEHYENADPSNLLVYQNQTSLRGQQIMEAINEVFPEAEVGVMHGPYMSVFDEGQPSAIVRQGGGPGFHELRGAFFTGMTQGLGPDQTLIDMGELYELRTAAEFAQSQEYRSDIIADLFGWSVDVQVRENWDDLVAQAHMVLTDEYPVGATMTPEIFEETLVNAFAHSEEAVFIFSNPGDEDWFTPNGLDPAWTQAVEGAITTAEAAPTEPETPVPELPEIDGMRVTGTQQADTLSASNAADVINGLGGNDDMASGGGNDTMNGGTGNDTMFGGAGNDQLNGGAHGDFLYGGGGNDQLDGQIGDDNIWGLWGHDSLMGGDGDDWIRGGNGDDVIWAGSGSDVVWGEDGGDTFVFAAGDGTNQIRDFERGSDVIIVAGASFADLTISQRGDATVVEHGGTQIEVLQTAVLDQSDFVF